MSNINAKLYVGLLKLNVTTAEITWLLFVNLIQKFQNAVQMCVP